jgi:NAD(P)-dependent dehydrogenase (short-subunit alcohol dehydrogenase family)
MSFTDKIVVITGAAGGIGTALTTRFLSEGAKICAVDTTEQALGKLKSGLGNPEQLISVVADISSEESCNNLFTELNKRWGAADILINNAGWFPFTPFEEVTHEEWRKVISINLDGPFLVTKSVLPLLKKSSAGRIINVSSGSVFSGNESQCHYVSAKAGVLGFTRCAAKALGIYNITVNSITPGLTATPALVKVVPPELLKQIKENGVLKREQMADDLVGAMVFLASDDAAFITGQTINVDGGRFFL